MVLPHKQKGINPLNIVYPTTGYMKGMTLSATIKVGSSFPAQAHGLRECALGGGGGQPRVPAWLEKWTALILEYVEEEQRLLPAQLLALPRNLAAYTPASAAAEAKGAPQSCSPALMLQRHPAPGVSMWCMYVWKGFSNLVGMRWLQASATTGCRTW